MHWLSAMLGASGELLLDSAPYVLLGLLAAGLIRVLLNPAAVARHLGGRGPGAVFKAAALGVPLPLCSCSVLPAAAALKRQGASDGATTAFLISTPESGVDSMAITYALMDPVMTLARPLAAFATASVAGLGQSLANRPQQGLQPLPLADLSCPVDNCCDGIDCPPEVHRAHHTLGQRLGVGLRFALGDLWPDLAGWFLLGLVVAGAVTSWLPPDLLGRHLGGGLGSLLIMLAAGIPIYICATASTPIAAALVMSGASPGAALVFLLAGPATNLTSLTMLWRVLGGRATAIYLGAIALMSLVCGLALDAVYAGLGISARAVAGQAAELVPEWLRQGSAGLLLGLSLWPALKTLARSRRQAACAGPACGCGHQEGH